MPEVTVILPELETFKTFFKNTIYCKMCMRPWIRRVSTPQNLNIFGFCRIQKIGTDNGQEYDRKSAQNRDRPETRPDLSQKFTQEFRRVQNSFIRILPNLSVPRYTVVSGRVGFVSPFKLTGRAMRPVLPQPLKRL